MNIKKIRFSIFGIFELLDLKCRPSLFADNARALLQILDNKLTREKEREREREVC